MPIQRCVVSCAFSAVCTYATIANSYESDVCGVPDTGYAPISHTMTWEMGREDDRLGAAHIPAQIGFDEGIEVAIEDCLHVAGLMVGAVVFDEGVGM